MSVSSQLTCEPVTSDGAAQESVMVEVVVSTLSISTTGSVLGGRTREQSDRYQLLYITLSLSSPNLMGSLTVRVVLDRCSEVAVMDMV